MHKLILQQNGIGQSLPRRLSQPMQVQREKQWLSEPFVRPYGILGTDSLDDLKDFEKLIWDSPSNLVIARYDQTPEEMAILCEEGQSRWLLSSHIRWIFKKVNLQQTKCINIVLNDNMPVEVALLAQAMGGAVERLNFVLSVGTNMDGNVSVSRVHQSRTRWVLASVDLTRDPTVLYCDSLGWPSPPDLLKHLSMYTAYFGITTLKRLVMMHVPADTGHTHRCTMDCKNYPIQTCPNAGGLVAVISAVLAALDTQLFNTLCGEKSNPTLFLHYPTRYEKYLRRVLIYWFMKDHIDVSLLQHLYSNLVNVTNSLDVDHSYSNSVASGKRKSTPLDLNPVSKRSTTYRPIAICNESRTHSSEMQNQSMQTSQNNCQNDYTNALATIAEQYFDIISLHDVSKKDKSKAKNKRNYACTFCKMSFACHPTLSKHIKIKHSDKSEQLKEYPCQCCMCSFSSPTIQELVTHYKNIHKRNLRVCEKSFENEEGFCQWKEEMEKSSSSRYISVEGAQTFNNSVVSYFSCHQSGHKGSPETPRAHSKSEIDQPCTSFMMACTDLDNSAVTVHYCVEHTGHSSNAKDMTAPDNAELSSASALTCNAGHVISKQHDMPKATDKSDVQQKKRRLCTICNQTFSSQQSLFKHKRRKHKDVYAPPSGTGTCPCTMCSYSFHTIQELIIHYNKSHKKSIQIRKRVFENEEDFRHWKQEVEKSSSSRYFSTRGKKIIGGRNVTYFYCNRSGYKRSKEPEPTARCRKKRGTFKMGTLCTSFMTARENLYNSTITVDYCLEHMSHSPNFSDLIIPEGMRSLIASSLLQGLEPAKVIEDLRNNMELHFISREGAKDEFHNELLYNTSKAYKTEEDAGSVDLWVKDLADNEDNPIIFYKPQNEKHELLKDTDFLLCVQTNFQKEMMLRYGPSVICADSVYRLTETGFLLVTLFVSNDHQEAIPVAWAIANREHSTVLQVFMRKLRDSCARDIKVKMFLSDASDELYNAWCTAFSQPSQRVYCSWHVDKRWKNKINTCFRNDNAKVDVYAILKTLQNETDENTFRRLVQICTVYLQKVSEEFCQYFIENFVVGNKTFLWAACFHEGLTINVESFHTVLKSVNSSRDQNGRVDDLLIILLEMAKEKNLDQIMKYEKGKIKHCVQEIRKSHNNSFDVVDIHKISEREWEVLSLDSVSKYHVCEAKQSPCHCKLVCPSCFVCVHMYTCNCVDFFLKDIICKHIHAVHARKQMLEEDSSDANVEIIQDNLFLEPREALSYTSKAGDTNEMERPGGASLQKDTNKGDEVQMPVVIALQKDTKKADETNDIERLRDMALQNINNTIKLLYSTNNIATIRAITESLDKTYRHACHLHQTEHRETL